MSSNTFGRKTIRNFTELQQKQLHRTASLKSHEVNTFKHLDCRMNGKSHTIIILYGLRAVRDMVCARGHSGVRTDGEARVPCATVPEGQTITFYPQTI